MTKLGLFIVMTFIAGFTALCQPEKGSFMVGGSLSFSASSYDGSTSVTKSSISLAPTASYFFFDRFAAGLLVGYSSEQAKYSLGFESNSYQYSVGATARYYFPIARRWAVFPLVKYEYRFQLAKATDTASGIESTSTSSANYVDLGAGITYFIARNVGIEGLLYTPLAPSEKLINFRVGLQVYINK